MFQDTQKMIVRVLPPKPSLLNETVASLGFTQRPVSVDVGTDREDFPPLSPNFSPATICKFTLRSAFGCMKLQGPRVEGDGSNPLKNGLSGGGIGITPFRSMIFDAAGRGLSRDVVLFYSNRSAEDAAFLSELEQLARDIPRFRLIATMTDAAGRQGERGFIDRELIERHVGDISKPVFYLAGPTAMVAAMETLLKQAGVKPESIRSEMFTGY